MRQQKITLQISKGSFLQNCNPKSSYNIFSSNSQMNNGQTKVVQKTKQQAKLEKKIHKRITRNKLIFLVGLHVFLIFCFSALITSQYLTENKHPHAMEILSDLLYVVYFILVLFAVKYKLKYLMMLSIVTLVVCAGLKVQLCVVESLDAEKLNVFYTIDVVFVLLNCIVPWRFLILWNELKETKWRETFDLRFKMNSYLLEDEIEPQNGRYWPKKP